MLRASVQNSVSIYD